MYVVILAIIVLRNIKSIVKNPLTENINGCKLDVRMIVINLIVKTV